MNASSARLSAITKELWMNWQRTKQYWNDVKSQEFEQKYLLELHSSVDRAVAVMDQLNELVGKIRKDCE